MGCVWSRSLFLPTYSPHTQLRMYEVLNDRVRDLLEEGRPHCAGREYNEGNTWVTSALPIDPDTREM